MMGNVYKVKLFIAVMYQPNVDPQEAVGVLTSLYGGVHARFGPIEFSWSEYYADEMGGNLKKIYLIFDEPIDRGRLCEIKNRTNDIERQLAADGRRTVNIDPGYLSRDKLVLASTKDFYHRVYIGGGIFGEATLHYRGGVFRFFSWTYPDYQREDFGAWLADARRTLLSDGN